MTLGSGRVVDTAGGRRDDVVEALELVVDRRGQHPHGIGVEHAATVVQPSPDRHPPFGSTEWAEAEAIHQRMHALVMVVNPFGAALGVLALSELCAHGTGASADTMTALDEHHVDARSAQDGGSVESGQARANQILSASLTPALKEIKLAELQRDTALAIASKQGNTVLLGGGAQPLVNVGK